MMVNIHEVIGNIYKDRRIKTVNFVGCGGSLACFYAPYYYIKRESDTISTSYTTSNEFVHDTPKFINEHSIVVVASRGGNTPETIEAAMTARELGALVIGLTYKENTELERNVDYIVQFNGDDDAIIEENKDVYALKIAYEALHFAGNNDTYDQMCEATNKLNDIIVKAKKEIIPEAVKFSIDFNDDNIVYTIGSGTAWAIAYQETVCTFLESQWINSGTIHSGEFFHGPFEITDPDTAFFMMMSTGATRELDERAIRFLKKYNKHFAVIDGKQYGMDDLGKVSGYYDALFCSSVVGVYNKLLADMRNHPLNKRKYMWKFDY
jgi:fructoselysine-6-P-deglycase FrlB-like protein